MKIAPYKYRALALMMGLCIQGVSFAVEEVAVNMLQPQVQASEPAPKNEMLSPSGKQEPVVRQAQIMPPPSSAPMMVMPNKLTPSEEQQKAFDLNMTATLGLTPDQIRELRRQLNLRASAVSELPVTPPESVSRSISYSLSPGSETPVIRPFINNITSFVILDSTGNPWPVENFRNKDSSFVVTRLDAATPNGSSFTVETTVMYAKSNLVLKLVGVVKPLVIDLIAGQKEMDASVEVHVMGHGPNAVFSHSDLPQALSGNMLSILDGIAPLNGRELKVDGVVNTKAWLLMNGHIMLRTAYKIVSPASMSFVSSADGTYVYEMMAATRLIGFKDGQFSNINISGI